MTTPTTAATTATAPLPGSPAAGPVLRARIAHTILRRVEVQRSRFVTAYGRATTPIDRVAAALVAVRSASPAPVTRSLAESTEVARRLDRIADDLADLFAELHDAQEAAAWKTIRVKQRTAARSQARRAQRQTTAPAVGGDR